MAEVFDDFKNWLLEGRDFLFSWITRDSKETQEPEESLEELPPVLREKLIAAAQDLPNNPADVEAITSALNEAFDKWRDRPQNSDNSVVIVSSPVTAVSRILTNNLADWINEKQISVNILSWTARPQNVTEIASELQRELKLGITKTEPESLEIVVIPNLSWCFLRNLEGLDAIDYLQSLLLQDRFRFWIIGVGLVAWDYLNSVTNFGAYCGKVVSLPELKKESLKAWLDPIFTEFDISFVESNLDPKLLDKDKSPEDRYFEKLASVAEGASMIAAQVFLRSIGYKSAEEPEENNNDNDIKNVVKENKLYEVIPDRLKKEARNLKKRAEAFIEDDKSSSSENAERNAVEKEKFSSENKPNEDKKILLVEKPELPDLPSLNSEDYYLLYSLLIHGDMTLSALSASLGDEESKVQAQVQTLRRAGIVEEKNCILQVNPIHYPKLKRELANNNFVIDEID